MIVQLVALLALTLLFLRERQMYLDRKTRARALANSRAERQARLNARPHTTDVTSSTVQPPLATVHSMWPRLVDEPSTDDGSAA